MFLGVFVSEGRGVSEWEPCYGSQTKQFNMERTEDGDSLKNSFSRRFHTILLAFESIRFGAFESFIRFLSDQCAFENKYKVVGTGCVLCSEILLEGQEGRKIRCL